MREAASFIASQTGWAPAGALSALLRDVSTAFRSWNARRHLKTLSEFDDHMLADIGITREDVRWALDLPFAYDPGIELQRRALRNRARGWRA
jgi:uncharacterized protein YjiS (DUF1127 family)